MINRNKLNFVVDALAALAFVLCIITAYGGREVRVWHGFCGNALVLMVLIHLFLHRQWTLATVKSLFGGKQQ